MPSAKTNRRLFSAATILLYAGVAVFFALVLYPVLAANRGDVRELGAAEDALGRWAHKTVLPTQTRIDAVKEYKLGMHEEYGRVVDYFRRRDQSLERKLLGTDSGNPVLVKLNYDSLKRRLEAKSHHAVAKVVIGKELLPLYLWEEPDASPAREDFPMIDKRTAIADAVIGLLAPTSCAVGHLAVGDPFVPGEGLAAIASEGAVPDASEDLAVEPEGEDSGTLSYIVWPVSIELHADFRSLGRTLDALVTPAANRPCIVLHELEVQGSDSNAVTVKVGIGILDFQ